MAVRKQFALARVNTSTTGTGTITLGSAVSGFLTFGDAGVSDGDVVSYAVSDGANSETGYGTYTASGTTLSRTVVKSTNSDSAISLSGSAQVFITPLPVDVSEIATPDTDASHYLKIAAGSNLSADRTLTIATGDASRTLTLSANATLTGSPVEQGLHTLWVPATAMVSRTTNGAASGTAETTTNKVMLATLDFDTATQEFAQFFVRMPKSWNEGTVTFAPTWSHASTTTNFGVVWGLAGVAFSNDDAADTAFGTAQTSTDTGGTTNDVYVGPTSSAITIAGTPAAEDFVVFQVNRTVSDGSDTMAIDARLHGVTLYFTLDAATDA